ncbi:LOW QUALITY PROTEIN: uncharacterized protein LOC143367923 [Andrena cerasifolii]|uniref:LOW QUALITY PROTEIN: uncharacterized protein LOC143367923 n=1 Tax=Andrena cerasifolii TaxID=2819439 RepID=UPI004037E9E1
MACGTVLLKLYVVHIHILQFRHKKLDYHVAIASTINCYCLTSYILEDEWSDDASNPKSARNSDTLWMHLFLNNHSIHLLFHNQFNETYSLCVVSKLQFLSQLNFCTKIANCNCQTFIILKILLNNENTLFFRVALIFNNPELTVRSTIIVAGSLIRESPKSERQRRRAAERERALNINRWVGCRAFSAEVNNALTTGS